MLTLNSPLAAGQVVWPAKVYEWSLSSALISPIYESVTGHDADQLACSSLTSCLFPSSPCAFRNQHPPSLWLRLPRTLPHDHNSLPTAQDMAGHQHALHHSGPGITKSIAVAHRNKVFGVARTDTTSTRGYGRRGFSMKR